MLYVKLLAVYNASYHGLEAYLTVNMNQSVRIVTLKQTSETRFPVTNFCGFVIWLVPFTWPLESKETVYDENCSAIS